MTRKEFRGETLEITKVARNKANTFLKQFERCVEINSDYSFDGNDCLAIYEGGSVFGGVIQISFNMKACYDYIQEETKKPSLFVTIYYA